MNPQPHPAPYAPWQPAARPARRERPAVAVLASLLWLTTFAALTWLAVLLGIVAVWGAAAGTPLLDFLLTPALILLGSAAALTALAFAPGIRRLAVSTRMLLLGALACPAPTALAIWTWLHTG
ncbi:hypothetical protein [Streptomyces sp. NPDC089799]|uniref:hypothetical protein n=1 Tax=Streptomyces sp. NPDC089799 TaxID=3155066 RepID=UPI0034343463